MQKERQWLGLGLLLALPLIATPAMAAPTQPLNVSQTPSVYAQKGIAPNLFLLLDDSGSMQYEFLGNRGDVGSGTSRYVYPQGGSNPYGGGAPYARKEAPKFAADNSVAAQYRAAYVNPNYYDPSVNYTPWACASKYPATGDRADDAPAAPVSLNGFKQQECHFDEDMGIWVMPDADMNKAFLDPSHTGQGFRSINVWNDASSSDYNNNKKNNGYIGNSGEPATHCGSGSGDGPYQVCINDTLNDRLNHTPKDGSPSSGPGHGTVVFQSGKNFTYTPDADYEGADSFDYIYESCPLFSGCSTKTATVHLDVGKPHPAGFWAATYFNYFSDRPGSGSQYRNTDNYERVQICPANATENSNGVSSDDVCTPPPTLPAAPATHHSYTDSDGKYVYVKGDGTTIIRTPHEALQNFANWYQYYRSHMLATQAGIGIAFMQIPTTFRVDYSTINILTGNISGHQIKSRESFTEDGAQGRRYEFLHRLYKQVVKHKNTPNPGALKKVGEWFASHPKSDAAPWGNSEDEIKASGSTPLACRANYVILATDGEWNTAKRTSNEDGNDGPTITGPGGRSYTYEAKPPYSDTHSSTLADMAMHYWKHDLQPDMDNVVPTNSGDGAFWQHMVTFTVGLGVVPSLVEDYMQANPDLDASEAQEEVFENIVNGDTHWPDATASKHQIDDTWHAAVDGHGTYASAGDPSELYKAISEALINIVNRTGASSSLSVNTEKTGATRTRQQVYQALFHPQNWWGDVLALPVVATPANGTAGTPASVAIADQADWSASCVLTGGQCDQTGTHVSRQQPSSRNIFTWDGGAKKFTNSALSPSALSTLGGANVVDYIRGMRNKEAGNGGHLRKRDSVLGDVVSSSPVYVAKPNKHYADSWTNFLYPGATPPENGASGKYSDFVAAHRARAPSVYAGANDGMLHAFYAPGADSAVSPGKYAGEELLAYVPKGVYANLGNYANSAYTHHYFVNATPGTGDLFDGSQWHTWLIGGEGAGGKSIFALDITNPASFDTSDVIGEWGPGNICDNAGPNCKGDDLGLTFGMPVITRFNNGQWGFVFGNGFNSKNGVASIFIGLVSGGNVTFHELKTGYGPDNDPRGDHRRDGIAFVTPVDLNGDHTTDYVYAGDYFGNVWRFDLTSRSTAGWHTTTYSGGPLFSAVNAHGAAQPITTKLLVVSVPGVSAGPRIMVEFGTGASITDAQQAPNTTDAGVQSLYGVWDWKFDHWNTLTNDAGVSAFQYDTLSSAPAYARDLLKQQSIIVEQTTDTIQGGTVNNRVITQDPVCWADIGSDQLPADCTGANNYGWYLDLVPPTGSNQGEKVVYSPVLRSGVFLVNTIIPSSSSGLTCQAAALTGWTMAFDPENGGRLPFEVFDTRGDGNFKTITLPDGTKVATSGITLGAVGSPGFVTYGGDTWMVVNTGSGKPTTARLNLPSENLAVQLSWQELR
jgi:type IV pilus assembly protein PilY1